MVTSLIAVAELSLHLSVSCPIRPNVTSSIKLEVHNVAQGFQEQEVKFQVQFISKFQHIFVGFTRLKNQKMHVFLCSYILISAAD